MPGLLDSLTSVPSLPGLLGLSPEQRRRRSAALMASQYDRPTYYDQAPVERAGLLPLGTYPNGQTGLAFPGFITEPVESWNRMLTAASNGERPSPEDSFNVAGAAMVGGLAAPRPANSVGALSSRIQHQIHEAQVAANPGADPGRLTQITRHPGGGLEVSSPKGNIDADIGERGIKVAGSYLDNEADKGLGYGSALYDRLVDYAIGGGNRLSSGYSVSPDAQRMWSRLAQDYPVTKAASAHLDPYDMVEPGTLTTPQARESVYSIAPQPPTRELPPPLPNALFANGGRQGAATGAAVNASADRPVMWHGGTVPLGETPTASHPVKLNERGNSVFYSPYREASSDYAGPAGTVQPYELSPTKTFVWDIDNLPDTQKRLGELWQGKTGAETWHGPDAPGIFDALRRGGYDSIDLRLGGKTSEFGMLEDGRSRLLSPAEQGLPPSYVSRRNTVFTNGGRQGAATGATLNAMAETPGIRAYHGARDTDLLQNVDKDWRGPWGSSRPEIASDYALEHPFDASSFTPDGAAMMPVEYRFSNPLTVDAGGKHFSDLRHPGNPRRRVDTEDLAWLAQDAGHDGLIVNNVRDMLSHEAGPTATTYAALRPGTVYSSLTGDLLYANGGRPGAATGAAVNALADQPAGIRAYHGSPHDFDKFDISRIGTGEGAQAYGHGLYFAENEGVAKSYRDALGDVKVNGAPPNWDDPLHWQALAMHEAKGDPAAASKLLDRYHMEAGLLDKPVIEAARSTGFSPNLPSVAEKGKMYEVNIKADPNDFLDWDKPLSQQSEKVKSFGAQYGFDDPYSPGSYAVRHAEVGLGDQRQKLPEMMREAGIPGIRYLDQGSRSAGEGSSNYVVFDDSLVDILRKYGLAGLTAGGAATNLLGQYPSQPQQQSKPWWDSMRDGDL